MALNKREKKGEQELLHQNHVFLKLLSTASQINVFIDRPIDRLIDRPINIDDDFDDNDDDDDDQLEPIHAMITV